LARLILIMRVLYGSKLFNSPMRLVFYVDGFLWIKLLIIIVVGQEYYESRHFFTCEYCG
jgi:hypothetical protein